MERMRRIFKGVLIFAGLALLAIQIVRPERTNPPLDPARRIHAAVEVPAEVGAILDRACRDCHSNETRWPWYSNVAPVSWFVIDHVNHGRSHLNFSEWNPPGGSLPASNTEDLLGAICKEVQAGAMPLPSYLLIHRGSRLSEADIRTICSWTESERQRLAVQARSGNPAP
jgi:hypothetical protein